MTTDIHPTPTPRRAGRGSAVRSVAAGAGALAILAGATTALSGSASGAPRPDAKAKSEVVVKEVMNHKLGAILATVKGMTLYRFTHDKVGKVACTGGCSTYWRALVLSGGATAPTGKGLKGLGTVRDPSGHLQVTYRGHPLYTYVGDTKAGTTNGQGVGGTWFACTVSVAPLTSGSGSHGSGGGATTTSAPKSGGYGY